MWEIIFGFIGLIIGIFITLIVIAAIAFNKEMNDD